MKQVGFFLSGFLKYLRIQMGFSPSTLVHHTTYYDLYSYLVFKCFVPREKQAAGRCSVIFLVPSSNYYYH